MPIAFNIRKRLVIHERLDVSTELRFLKMLFTKHPKSPSSWDHRRWCLRISLRQSHTESCQSAMALDSAAMLEERELCRHMADIYPKNYYAWVHRLWLLQFMDVESLHQELQFTYLWLQSHVSDHSASNHRQQVIERLFRSIAVGSSLAEYITLPSPSSRPSFFEFGQQVTRLELLKTLFAQCSALIRNR